MYWTVSDLEVNAIRKFVSNLHVWYNKAIIYFHKAMLILLLPLQPRAQWRLASCVCRSESSSSRQRCFSSIQCCLPLRQSPNTDYYDPYVRLLTTVTQHSWMPVTARTGPLSRGWEQRSCRVWRRCLRRDQALHPRYDCSLFTIISS